MSDWFGISLTVLLLAFNAFFVGAEFALIAARRDRLEALIAQGKKRAKTVLGATEHLSMMLAAAQLGITICSLLLGKVSEPAIAHLLEEPFAAVGVPGPPSSYTPMTMRTRRSIGSPASSITFAASSVASVGPLSSWMPVP